VIGAAADLRERVCERGSQTDSASGGANASSGKAPPCIMMHASSSSVIRRPALHTHTRGTRGSHAPLSPHLPTQRSHTHRNHVALQGLGAAQRAGRCLLLLPDWTLVGYFY
jgi:hypothetical protein